MKKILFPSLATAAILLGCLTVFFVNSTHSAHAAAAPKTAKTNAPTAAYCVGALSGWKVSKTGGFVGPNIYDFDPPCDGTYSYIASPTTKVANFSLRGNLDGGTAYLWTYLPTNRAGATKAIYKVTTDNGTWTFTINQRRAAGWYRLGKFTFIGYGISASVSAAPDSHGDLLADAVWYTGA